MRTTSRIMLTALVLLLPYWLGCSLIGFGIGAIADGADDDRPHSGRTAEFAAHGSTMTLRLIDGTEIVGTYAGVETLSPAAYNRVFRAVAGTWGRDSCAIFPGDTVTVRNNEGSSPGVFLWTDRESVFLFRITREGGDTLRFPLDDTGELTLHTGAILRGSDLRLLMAACGLPSRTSYRLAVDGTLRYVAPETVEFVSTESPTRGGKWIGLGIGAVIDVAVILMLKAEAEKPADCSGLETEG